MPQADFKSRRKSRLPLSFRISFILMLAAVLPLVLIVISEYVTARPALINQADQALQTDATTRVQLIDAYLNERLLDAATLSQVPTVQTFLAEPADVRAADKSGQLHAGFALLAGEARDKRYISWGLFDANGAMSLDTPMPTDPQQLASEATVAPEFLQAMKADKNGQPIISPVYYNPTTQKAFVSIYSPIYAGPTPNLPFLGFMRAKLSLDYIWDIVRNDRGVDTTSGSSFILDQNGVRIADSDQANLFTAVAPVPQDVQHLITTEKWYGQSSSVPVQADATLSSYVQSSNAQPVSFTLTPNGKSEDYQVALVKEPLIHWNYFVISRSSVVTQVADQQLLTTLIVAGVVALLAIGIGFWVASRITRPILRSVDQLRENSESLNVLAKKQQSSSSEQLWVVDSIQVGLQSLQYYTDATRIATHKMGEIGTELERGWHRQNAETIRQGLQQIISAATYIEKATHYQNDSSQKLNTAIKVTTQVNEQLADGAISATEAASQLEQVVNDLRNVVGGQ